MEAMTAIISVNTLAAPGGFLVAGQVIERWGVVPVFTAVAAGLSIMALGFAAIVFRHREEDEELAVPLQAAA